MEFITEIEKKKHIKHILGIEVETENYNENDFYSCLPKNDMIYTY